MMKRICPCDLCGAGDRHAGTRRDQHECGGGEIGFGIGQANVSSDTTDSTRRSSWGAWRLNFNKQSSSRGRIERLRKRHHLRDSVDTKMRLYM